MFRVDRSLIRLRHFCYALSAAASLLLIENFVPLSCTAPGGHSYEYLYCGKPRALVAMV
jgi:hypothetical protein